VGSGVAAGANTLFFVLAGRLGEKEVDGGLSVMAEARKIFRAVAMEPCVKLLDGISSRVISVFLVDDCCGVPRRLAEPGPKGDDAAKARFAKGRGGRDRGVPWLAASATSSPGMEKVTIWEDGAEEVDGNEKRRRKGQSI
jgi:hypothetical protein